jgi:hypothetical protein
LYPTIAQHNAALPEYPAKVYGDGSSENMNEQPNGRVAISASSSVADKGPGHHGFWQASALMLAGLVVTAFVTRYTKSEVDTTAKREFDFVCNEIQTKILDRLSAHEQILRSGAAFCEDSDGVTRKEWYRFTERQKVEQQLPGVLLATARLL